MTEHDAREWLAARFDATAVARLEAFVAMVTSENERQNLIAPGTIPVIWSRHIVDSAQLLLLAPPEATSWLDVGTGAGFPGMVVAILFGGRTVLVEPRARRAAFLNEAAATLNVTAEIVQARVQGARPQEVTVVSARAVASLDAILSMTAHIRARDTTYLLPRGRSGESEVANVSARWHGLFHVEHSLTDPASTIIIATGVAPRCSASR